MKHFMRIFEDGTNEYFLGDSRHRENGPAIEYPDGEKRWYRNGYLHRKDGPAIEYPDGSKKWYKNGKLHREDGPAIEWSNGSLEWYLEGKRNVKQDWEKELTKLQKEKEIPCEDKVIEINGKKYRLILI